MLESEEDGPYPLEENETTISSSPFLRSDLPVPFAVADRMAQVHDGVDYPTMSDVTLAQDVRVGQWWWDRLCETPFRITDVQVVGDRVRVSTELHDGHVLELGRTEEIDLCRWYQSAKDVWGWHDPISNFLVEYEGRFWLVLDGAEVVGYYATFEEAAKDFERDNEAMFRERQAWVAKERLREAQLRAARGDN